MSRWLPPERRAARQTQGQSYNGLAFLGLLLAIAALCAGCATENPITGSREGSSCADCHLSKDRILATADPDTTEPGETGEG